MSVNHFPSHNSDESGKQCLYPDGDPDRHQNLTICSLAHCQLSLKILCKSVCAKLLTDRQKNNDDYITSLMEVINWATTIRII